MSKRSQLDELRRKVKFWKKVRKSFENGDFKLPVVTDVDALYDRLHQAEADLRIFKAKHEIT